MEWKKISANHISDKGLIFQIYREAPKIQHNNKKIQFKMGKGLE